MDIFQISDFLQDFNKERRYGSCKSCQKAVKWSRECVASHKRSSCQTASAEEKKKFAKRPRESSFNASSNSLDESNSNISTDGDQSQTSTSYTFTTEQANEIDAKLANFFFRTGISFRLADADSFKDLVKALNPAYARIMPSSKSVTAGLTFVATTSSISALNRRAKNLSSTLR